MITMAGTARQIDVPLATLKSAVDAGTLVPDAQSQCGRKLFVFFKPSRMENLKLMLAGKPQIVA